MKLSNFTTDLGDNLAGGAAIAASSVISGASLDDLSDVNASAPSDNDVLLWDAGASEWVASELSVADLDYANIVGFIDGGGSALTTGTKCWVSVGFGGSVQAATIVADQSGNCIVDINKRAFGGGAASSICASAKPTLSSAQEATDSTLTGWTTTFSAGDIFYWEVEGTPTVTAVMVSLKVLKT